MDPMNHEKHDSLPPEERQHYLHCPHCQHWVDMRDLVDVLEHRHRAESLPAIAWRGAARALLPMRFPQIPVGLN
jgi:hypothetical protein